VRRYEHASDADSVRQLWSTGLLDNCATYMYPPSLVSEEEQFVRDTLKAGDMVDLQNVRYTCWFHRLHSKMRWTPRDLTF
jgi:hypothetical protein